MNIDKKSACESEVFFKRLVLYMDILGTVETGKNNRTKTLLVREILKEFSNINRKNKIEYRLDTDGVTVITGITPTISSFSDHIAISLPAENIEPLDSKQHLFILMDKLIDMASEIHMFVLEKGFLIRGAMTQGELYHDGSVIQGDALNCAVELEEKAAIFPRVIITPELVDIYKKQNNLYEISHLCRDFDGLYYIDYLQDKENTPIIIHQNDTFIAFFNQIYDLIDMGLNDNKAKLSILAKWQWLAIKYDQSLDFYSERYEFLRSDLGRQKRFNLM